MCVGFRRGSHHQETVPQGEDRVLGQVEGMESKVWLSILGSRARICRRLRSPRIESNESTASLCGLAWRGWESIPGLLKRFTNSGSDFYASWWVGGGGVYKYLSTGTLFFVCMYMDKLNRLDGFIYSFSKNYRVLKPIRNYHMCFVYCRHYFNI